MKGFTGFKAQFKHAVLIQKNARLSALSALTAVNVFFILLGLMDTDGTMSETGFAISGMALTGLMVMAAMAAYVSYENTFKTPNCYLTLLTPVKRWKILLAKITANFMFDVMGVALGLAGLLTQDYIFVRNQNAANAAVHGHMVEMDFFSNIPVAETLCIILLGIVGYFTIASLIFFGGAMGNSIFAKYRYSTVLSGAATIVFVWLMCLIDFALMFPVFGANWMALGDYSGFAWVVIERLPIFHVEIPLSANPAMIFYLVTLAIRGIILFTGASYLLERRVNV
jgi:hypothetical protein